jgi:transcriptional regulator with XRE-family HTH domain
LNLQELPVLLGARIRICIEKAGYPTVEKFAFAFGLSKATLSDVLTGNKSPTVSTLARWANALEIPLADFFRDDRLNTWVRETPPEYFQNRGKNPRGGKSKAPKGPKPRPKGK